MYIYCVDKSVFVCVLIFCDVVSVKLKTYGSTLRNVLRKEVISQNQTLRTTFKGATVSDATS